MMSDLASALAFSHVDVEVAAGVATVALRNPPVNALSRELSDQLTDALDRISELAEIRVVVLTGRGHVFCAGADLKNRDRYLANPGDFAAHSRRARECFHAVRECAKPVVAAVNGPALGAGLAIVASADIIVAAEEASLGLPEVKVGLLGGCSHALRLFGHSRTRRMALTGYRVSGPELYRLGVAEECTSAWQAAADCPGHRQRDSRGESGRGPDDEAHTEHRRGIVAPRWLPVRAGHDRDPATFAR